MKPYFLTLTKLLAKATDIRTNDATANAINLLAYSYSQLISKFEMGEDWEDYMKVYSFQKLHIEQIGLKLYYPSKMKSLLQHHKFDYRFIIYV